MLKPKRARPDVNSFYSLKAIMSDNFVGFSMFIQITIVYTNVHKKWT